MDEIGKALGVAKDSVNHLLLRGVTSGISELESFRDSRNHFIEFDPRANRP